jgi:glyoxylase-like metal-dependent hydrolase (beta-lactamase superfamily II)
VTGRWVDVADGVLARRHEQLDQTLGLVVGQERCLVVDTGTDEVHGAEWAAAVRAVTPLPWTVVVTHAHFDHFCGTAAFVPCPVWAHPGCRTAMVSSAEHRRDWVDRYEREGEPELARRLAGARVVLPTRFVDDRVTLDLGGRVVELVHPGPAHTDHDVFAHVPDARVVFAGDLVEQGAPASVGPDAHPDRWPAALDVLLALSPEVVVPGHGDTVDAAFVRTQRAELARPPVRR